MWQTSLEIVKSGHPTGFIIHAGTNQVKTNVGFWRIFEASLPLQSFVLVNSYVPRNAPLVIASSVSAL
jgi:hypothetical protein